MVSRIARIEADVSHINSALAIVQVDLRELRTDLRHGLDAANEAIAEVKSTAAVLDGEVTTLKAEVRADLAAMEAKRIKWMIGTMLACTSAALAIAKTVH